jgi:hypothetical protein
MWVVYKGTASAPGGGWGFGPGVNWPAPIKGVQLIERSSNPSGSLVTRELIDMNGDGRVDLVNAGGTSSTYWNWYPNTGSGFLLEGQRFDTGAPGLHISFTDDDNGVQWGTFDINGDGFPDHVNADATSWEVCINTGQELGTCAPWPLPANFGGQVGYVRKSTGSEPLDTVRDFFDLNGDGLPDIVDKTGGQWRVLINRGGGFEQDDVTWTAPPFIRNGSEGGGGVKADTFDVDGDGLVDHVTFDGSDGSPAGRYGIRRLFDGAWKTEATGNPTVVENTNGGRPDLLILSESGSGGSTALNYRPSTQWTNIALPFNVWTLTDLVHRDGLCPAASLQADGSCSAAGHEVGTTITYGNGRYDPVEREFRGFGVALVEALVADDATPHTADLHYYHQSASLAGRLAQTWSWDASGTGDFFSKPLSLWSSTWECANPTTGAVLTACPASPAGDAWVRLKSTNTITYSNFSHAQFKESLTVNESWHLCTPSGGGQARSFGNVAHARRGAVSGGPQLHTHSEYACRNEPNGYLVDRPVHVLVQDEANTVLEERWFWYDGFHGGANFGKVERGTATRSEALVDVNDTAPASTCSQAPATPGGCVATSMTVDANSGHVTQVTDGLGRVTTTVYDSDALYPMTVTRPAPAVGQPTHKVKTVYDPKCGALLEQTIAYTAAEPAATERARHQYDVFCRPWKSWIPGDAANATPATEYGYQIGAPAKLSPSPQDGKPTATRTKRREPSNPLGVVTAVALADGLGRVIQTKSEAVVDTNYSRVATARPSTTSSAGRWRRMSRSRSARRTTPITRPALPSGRPSPSTTRSAARPASTPRDRAIGPSNTARPGRRPPGTSASPPATASTDGCSNGAMPSAAPSSASSTAAAA